MSFKDDWQREKERKRMQRDVVQFQRRMASPVARGEVYQLGETQMMHLASLALAMEALEDILVGAGVLDRDELMDCMELIAKRKAEQATAEQAVAQQTSNIVI